METASAVPMEDVSATFVSSNKEVQLLGLTSPGAISPQAEGSQPSATEALDGQEVKWHRLGGAARKRFKKLQAQGIPVAQARELARKPSDVSENVKRPSSDGSTLPDQVKRAKMGTHQSELEGAELSYREEVVGIRLGIMAADFPSVHLTQEQKIAVKEAMLDSVLENTDDRVQPSYHSCIFRPGYLIFACKDKTTAAWTKWVGERLTPWRGARLKVVEDKDLPRPQILTVYLPHSLEDSNERILGYFKKQNVTLNVDCWRVISRKSEGHCVQLILSIDSGTAEVIKAVPHFHANFKFGTVPLKLKGGRQENFP